MLNANQRELALSDWLKTNGTKEYNSISRLHAFLLLYEMFSKSRGDTADFTHPKEHKDNLVFYGVLNDYTHNRDAFDKAAEEAYFSHKNVINTELARKSHFIARILSESELSELIHGLDIWNAKKSPADDLDDGSLSKKDAELIALLDEMYPASLIENSEIIEINSHYFIFAKCDADRLTEQHITTLSALTDNERLENPIYTSLNEDGRLIID